MASSDFSTGFLLDFSSSAYTSRYGICDLPTGGDLSCSIACFHNIPLSLRRRVLDGCTSRFFAASMAFTFAERLGSLFFPFGLTFRRCKIHFMLRAAASHPFLRGIQRFGTSSRPNAPVACYPGA